MWGGQGACRNAYIQARLGGGRRDRGRAVMGLWVNNGEYEQYIIKEIKLIYSVVRLS